jgi:hypothetical protein
VKPDRGFDVRERFLVGAACADDDPLHAEWIGYIAIDVLLDNDFDLPHLSPSEV